MKVISTANAPQAIGPYSQGIWVGSLVFFAGQIPLDPVSMNVVGTSIEEQTEQVLKNVKGLLGACGLGLSHVVKTTVFLKNMSEFARFNEVYARYFSVPFPARSTVEVSELPKKVLIEIEAIATFENVS